jgi:hypothetical protein
MITWNVTASFFRHCNLANVKIPLHQFLNDFKILETKIENDSLILQFAQKNHYFCDSIYVLKPTEKSLIVFKG